MNKFKVGDKVICVGDFNNLSKSDIGRIAGFGFEKDKIFTIHNINDCGESVYYFPSSGNGVEEKALKLFSDPTPKFKVGDEVRIKGKSVGGSLEISNIYIHGGPFFITKIYGNGEGTDEGNCIVVDTNRRSYCGDYFAPQDLELVEECLTSDSGITPYPTGGWLVELKKQTKTMNIIDKIKQLALSKEDRALRDNGFEDDNGKMTSTAKEMMSEELLAEKWAERRKDVAGKLLEIKKSDS